MALFPTCAVFNLTISFFVGLHFIVLNRRVPKLWVGKHHSRQYHFIIDSPHSRYSLRAGVPATQITPSHTAKYQDPFNCTHKQTSTFCQFSTLGKTDNGRTSRFLRLDYLRREEAAGVRGRGRHQDQQSVMLDSLCSWSGELQMLKLGRAYSQYIIFRNSPCTGRTRAQALTLQVSSFSTASQYQDNSYLVREKQREAAYELQIMPRDHLCLPKYSLVSAHINSLWGAAADGKCARNKVKVLQLL